MEHAHGLFLRRITRQGKELPITRDTKVHVCDVIQLIGEKESVEKAVKAIGYAERPSAMTDIITVGIGCVLGTLIGLIVVPVAGIPLTLGVGGGVLLAGLIMGWLRAVHPTFGQFPNASQWILSNLGIESFYCVRGPGRGATGSPCICDYRAVCIPGGYCLMPFAIYSRALFRQIRSENESCSSSGGAHRRTGNNCCVEYRAGRRGKLYACFRICRSVCFRERPSHDLGKRHNKCNVGACCCSMKKRDGHVFLFSG